MLSDDGSEAGIIKQRNVSAETSFRTSGSWIYLDKLKHTLDEDSPSGGRLVRDHYNVHAPMPLSENLISLLHLAILHDQRRAVRYQVEEFGADTNQPFRAMKRRSQSTSVTAPLTLALRLPLAASRKMTRLLINLGASMTQTDNHNMTALQSCIALKPAVLETYYSANPTAVSSASTAIQERGRGTGTAVSTPLLTAIETRNTDIAVQLLHQGACTGAMTQRQNSTRTSNSLSSWQ